MLNDPLKPQTPMITSSRLSKTFHEVLHDKDALPYFREFLKSQSAEHIIQFWLDAESFQASSWTRIRSQSVKSQNRNTSSRETSGTGGGTAPGCAGSQKQSGTQGGNTVLEDKTQCANCDKEQGGGENVKSNGCDKGEGHSVQTGGAGVKRTSQSATNDQITKPAGQVDNVPSNHSNPPDVTNQSDSLKQSSALPIEMTSTTPPSISQSSQIQTDSNSDGHSTSSSAEPGSSSAQPPRGPAMRSQPSTSPGSSPPHVKSPPRSPTADNHSDNSIQIKLKKSKSVKIWLT